MTLSIETDEKVRLENLPPRSRTQIGTQNNETNKKKGRRMIFKLIIVSKISANLIFIYSKSSMKHSFRKLVLLCKKCSFLL